MDALILGLLLTGNLVISVAVGRGALSALFRVLNMNDRARQSVPRD